MTKPGRIALALLLVLAACGAPPAPQPGTDAGPRAVPVAYPAFADRDPVDWPGRGPRAYPVHGIDVARFQGEIDWAAARASGVSFAFIKATEGGDRLDPRFEENWRGARAAGVARGAYHVYYFCRPPEEQARWFVRHVPRDALALPPVLDIEWNPLSPTCQRRPDGATVRAEATRFLALLERRYGRRPILYTTVDFYRDTGIGQLPNTEFWLRSVAGLPRDVYPGQPWRFWQYTATGVVPGIEGPVDLNVFSGSPEAWAAWGR